MILYYPGGSGSAQDSHKRKKDGSEVKRGDAMTKAGIGVMHFGVGGSGYCPRNTGNLKKLELKKMDLL